MIVMSHFWLTYGYKEWNFGLLETNLDDIPNTKIQQKICPNALYSERKKLGFLFACPLSQLAPTLLPAYKVQINVGQVYDLLVAIQHPQRH
jgi:hypothetical protein